MPVAVPVGQSPGASLGAAWCFSPETHLSRERRSQESLPRWLGSSGRTLSGPTEREGHGSRGVAGPAGPRGGRLDRWATQAARAWQEPAGLEVDLRGGRPGLSWCLPGPGSGGQGPPGLVGTRRHTVGASPQSDSYGPGPTSRRCKQSAQDGLWGPWKGNPKLQPQRPHALPSTRSPGR